MFAEPDPDDAPSLRVHSPAALNVVASPLCTHLRRALGLHGVYDDRNAWISTSVFVADDRLTVAVFQGQELASVRYVLGALQWQTAPTSDAAPATIEAAVRTLLTTVAEDLQRLSDKIGAVVERVP